MFGHNTEVPRREDPIQVAIREVGNLIRSYTDEDERMVEILNTFNEGNHLQALYAFEEYVEEWESSDVKKKIQDQISLLKDSLGIEE